MSYQQRLRWWTFPDDKFDRFELAPNPILTPITLSVMGECLLTADLSVRESNIGLNYLLTDGIFSLQIHRIPLWSIYV